MDPKTTELLRTFEDKRIAGLLRGVYDFFDRRFTMKGFCINAHVSEQGYHMDYLGTEYNIRFAQEDNMSVIINVKLNKKDDGLEERVHHNRVSNSQLSQTKYFAEQKIETDGVSIKLSCRLKHVPDSVRDVNYLCGQLWGKVIQPVMLSIHEYSGRKS